jgi:DNA-binding MarR family transcriptional regulator
MQRREGGEMTKEKKAENPNLETFLALHRTRDLLFRCHDRVVQEFGLTAEQYTVLLAVKYLDDPVRATDIGGWMERKVNSVSMIVDRMVRAGLVDRTRDLPDRREVRVALTRKGEKALEQATPGVMKLADEMLSPLKQQDHRTLTRLLDRLVARAHKHLSTKTRARR